MSLMACPCVEFLDEPTTGVDPVSRRSLFKMLKHLPNCSLILTTHRMEEAEQLCDNIAIMINGRFCVYGSCSHLKDSYGQGYSVSLFQAGSVEAMNTYVGQNLPFLRYKDSAPTQDFVGEIQVNQYFYQIDSNQVLLQNGGLSSLFGHLTQMKEQGAITDFQATRSSLEQVFTEFAKHQIEQADLTNVL